MNKEPIKTTSEEHQKAIELLYENCYVDENAYHRHLQDVNDLLEGITQDILKEVEKWTYTKRL